MSMREIFDYLDNQPVYHVSPPMLMSPGLFMDLFYSSHPCADLETWATWLEVITSELTPLYLQP